MTILPPRFVRALRNLRPLAFGLALCAALTSAVRYEALACALGFAGAGYPRPIRLSPDKAPLVNGTSVRVFKCHGRIWHIPSPGGFADIESLTRNTLPEWLHVPAFNLREHTLAFYAAPEWKNDGLPKWSIAEIAVYDSELTRMMIYVPPAAETYETLRRRNAGDPLVRYLRGETASFDPALWNQLRDKHAPYSDGTIRLAEERGVVVTLGYANVTGDWEPGEKERRVALYKRLDPGALRENATEEEIRAYIELSAKFDAEFPVGGSVPSLHPGIAVSVDIPFGAYHVVMYLTLGPGDTPEIMKDALGRALRWTHEFLAVNPRVRK